MSMYVKMFDRAQHEGKRVHSIYSQNHGKSSKLNYAINLHQQEMFFFKFNNPFFFHFLFIYLLTFLFLFIFNNIRAVTDNYISTTSKYLCVGF